ncbi:iron ABC transporter permease [Bacillus shivajii]|uniref:FecCD family ABC transporter permease n=1 Tax=Bacillus shivajii TaxID=1983719 RepID=UPI001CFAF229|nr:iron ABC transporter permease [Bacillus shivajii]UCZ53752.1 iron ABC transporter permease [Bacillus shivajii]
MSKFVIRNKSGSISFQVDKKSFYTLLYLFLTLIFLFIISLSMGSSWISPIQVVQQLVGMTDEHGFVINTLRLPRALLAFLVGAALGVSGLILQGIVRNPLASPDIIGITGGASVGAILFIVTFAGQVSMSWLPLAAITGAAVVSIFIYLLSWKNGVTPIRLILIGIGIAAGMSALTTMMIVSSDIATAGRAYIWLTGSIYGASWGDVYGLLPWVVILLPITLVLARIVNAKELGDDVAHGLGVRVQYYRFLLLFISVALAGSSVAFAGGIGFVGLIAPHIARKLIGMSFAALVPAAALIGGLIVTIADLVARTAFLPLDIPAGVFTAGIGAPFFIYLLFKTKI